jgi:acyl-CoA synthetase (AMP-forming)/AMP-acid ligase II
MTSIFQRLDHWAHETPDKLMYCFLDISGNETEKYTYSEFLYRTNAIAGYLHQEHGIVAGDRLLMAYPPGLEMICAFFACIRLGAIPVPAYPPTSHGFESSLNKMTYIAKDCQAKAILTSRDYFWTMKLNISRNNAETFFGSSYMSKLDWINTEDFRDGIKRLPRRAFRHHVSPIYLRLHQRTERRDGDAPEHPAQLRSCHRFRAARRYLAAAIPRYGPHRLLYVCALKGGTTYGFAPIDFIQRPALWLESISKYKANASSAPNFAYEYCLQPARFLKKHSKTSISARSTT